MSTQNHYETLGVDESSSFEEIQDARDRLLQESSENKKHAEAIEAAYDAILMNRLRLRQEGKIKVPDKIRFPEKEADAPKKASQSTSKQVPAWLNQLMDNPSRNEVLWPAGAFLGTAILGIVAESAGLAVGFIVALFFLTRKENKFFRSFLLTFSALMVGALVGALVGQSMASQLNGMELSIMSFTGIVTSFFFWLVSSFFR
ncbi:MAG: CPP1-like family protein [Cyanobacteria bacterium P01_E01_bin.6]